MPSHTQPKNTMMEFTYKGTKVVCESSTSSFSTFKAHATTMAQPGFIFRGNTFTMSQALGDLASHMQNLTKNPFHTEKFNLENFGTISAASKWALVLHAVFDFGKRCCLDAEDFELPLSMESIAIRIMKRFKGTPLKAIKNTSPGFKRIGELGQEDFVLLMQYATAYQKPVDNESLKKMSRFDHKVHYSLKQCIMEMFEINNRHTNNELVYSPHSPGPSNKELEKIILREQKRIDSLMFGMREVQEQKKHIKALQVRYDIVSIKKLEDELDRVTADRDNLARRLRAYEPGWEKRHGTRKGKSTLFF
ncbi:hypothetical protein ACHAQA_009436 [Verticillium albo-atrum]